ncbi:transcriptional regulator [Blumeria hordei DH14]|uniref:Transcriptional regulator n=1 Tax=Blumeria graminis f. sp. hordei (strain DH14) TaxID=546991 RepID=A0A078N0K1_BLUG1|nr:transcriptional regulator [Blumeria hordei DH14]
MIPSDEIIVAELSQAVDKEFSGPQRDLLTVRRIRSQVEASLDLTPGRLSESDWKLKAKSTIESRVQELLRAEVTRSPTPCSPVREASDPVPVLPSPKRARVTSGPAKPRRRAGAAVTRTADATLTTLQTQLRKCGLRTIWSIELKKYGDDRSAKIRHLQQVLSDIGMTGRFSEAKAKQIKEARELQADLEEVQEGDKAWGLPKTRKARKDHSTEGCEVTVKEISQVISQDPSSADESVPVPRKRRARPALDWLSAEDSDE